MKRKVDNITDTDLIDLQQKLAEIEKDRPSWYQIPYGTFITRGNLEFDDIDESGWEADRIEKGEHFGDTAIFDGRFTPIKDIKFLLDRDYTIDYKLPGFTISLNEYGQRGIEIYSNDIGRISGLLV